MRRKKIPSAIPRYSQRTAASSSPKTRTAWKNSPKLHYSVRARGAAGPPAVRGYDGLEMAVGHSVDEYLETIYFLAFPIGEYHPQDATPATLSSRVAEML